MFPVLFHIGDFPVRTFGLLLAISALVGMLMAGRRAPRYGLRPDSVWDLCFWLIIAGVLGARLLFILQEWRSYAANPGELLKLQFDGLTSFGGLIGGTVAAAIWSRRARVSLVTLIDMLAIPVLVAHALGRVGCLFNGCCYGPPTSGPLGVHMVELNSPYPFHQPAQLYDMAMLLAGAWIASRLEARGLRPGQSGALMLIVYGTSRFIFEFWRIEVSSTRWGSLPVTEAQAAALLMLVAGLIWFRLAGRRSAGASPP